MEHSLHWQHGKNSSPWLATDSLITSWLQQREKLWVLFNHIGSTHPLKPTDTETEAELLQSFRELLVDYISAGHFQIFEKISEATEGLDENTLNKILYTTSVALEFDENYSERTNFDHLKSDLSKLGIQLSNRMDFEDNLIKKYLQATHKNKKMKDDKTKTVVEPQYAPMPLKKKI